MVNVLYSRFNQTPDLLNAHKVNYFPRCKFVGGWLIRSLKINMGPLWFRRVSARGRPKEARLRVYMIVQLLCNIQFQFDEWQNRGGQRGFTYWRLPYIRFAHWLCVLLAATDWCLDIPGYKNTTGWWHRDELLWPGVSDGPEGGQSSPTPLTPSLSLLSTKEKIYIYDFFRRKPKMDRQVGDDSEAFTLPGLIVSMSTQTNVTWTRARDLYIYIYI